MTKEVKTFLKEDLVEGLHSEKKINKIVVFGSFVKPENLNGNDGAMFLNGDASYLILATKSRLTDEECGFLDSICLSSTFPPGNVLP